MKTKITIIFLLLLVFIITSCSQQQTKYVCPDGSTVYDSSLCPKSKIQQETNQEGAIQVECTNNNACPNGMICDLSLTNYGKCIRQSVPWYCGDGNCDRDESERSCPQDCG